MKKILLTIALVAISFGANAQSDSGFGIKGGLNYGGSGDYFEDAQSAAENPDKNIGYHVGIFGKLGNKIYLRPELVYTVLNSDYGNNGFKMTKIDAPILLGVKLIGPLNIFGGPALQYIVDTDYEDITVGDVKDEFSVGLNLGVGLSFGKFGVDLRYERGFKENEANVINNNIQTGGRIDTRPDQLILSLAIQL